MLNRKGKLSCEAGNNVTLMKTVCVFDGARRVKILSDQKMHNKTYHPKGYRFIVHGVEQPKDLTTYGKMYAAVLNKDGLVMDQNTALADPGITAVSAPKAIQVLDYSVSTNYTRSTATFTMDVVLPAGEVTADKAAFVQFPGDFCSAFATGFIPSCTLNRFKADWSGQDSENWVNNCSYVKGRKIKIFLKADTK